MMKFDRPPQPSFLVKNYKRWGREQKAKRLQDPTASFQWRIFQGKRVTEHLLEALTPAAKNHCAFCDGYPLGTFARQTLEHFRPKSLYPQLAYVWWNLFVCCDQCQANKGENFDRKLLKPDRVDYAFERFFIINYRNGEIEINPKASAADQERAQITIEMYGLNRHGRPQSRLSEYRKFQDLRDKGYSLDDFSYRFFME